MLAWPRVAGASIGSRIKHPCEEYLVEALGVQDVEPNAGRLDVDRLDVNARKDKDVAGRGLHHLPEDVVGHSEVACGADSDVNVQGRVGVLAIDAEERAFRDVVDA